MKIKKLFLIGLITGLGFQANADGIPTNQLPKVTSFTIIGNEDEQYIVATGSGIVQ